MKWIGLFFLISNAQAGELVLVTRPQDGTITQNEVDGSLSVDSTSSQGFVYDQHVDVPYQNGNVYFSFDSSGILKNTTITDATLTFFVNKILIQSAPPANTNCALQIFNNVLKVDLTTSAYNLHGSTIAHIPLATSGFKTVVLDPNIIPREGTIDFMCVPEWKHLLDGSGDYRARLNTVEGIENVPTLTLEYADDLKFVDTLQFTNQLIFK